MPRFRDGRVGYSTDRLKGKKERENMKPRRKLNREKNKLIRKLETKDRSLSHFPFIHPLSLLDGELKYPVTHQTLLGYALWFLLILSFYLSHLSRFLFNILVMADKDLNFFQYLNDCLDSK